MNRSTSGASIQRTSPQSEEVDEQSPDHPVLEGVQHAEVMFLVHLPQQLRVTSRQPFREEIEPPPPAGGPDALSPPGPAREEILEPEKADDFRPRGVFEQPDAGPVPVEGTDGVSTGQHLPEPVLVDVVVPHIG